MIQQTPVKNLPKKYDVGNPNRQSCRKQFAYKKWSGWLGEGHLIRDDVAKGWVEENSFSKQMQHKSFFFTVNQNWEKRVNFHQKLNKLQKKRKNKKS